MYQTKTIAGILEPVAQQVTSMNLQYVKNRFGPFYFLKTNKKIEARIVDCFIFPRF